MEQLSSVETLCDAELSSERIKQVRKKYPHLLEKLEEEDYKIILRSSYRELSVLQMKRMSNVFIKKEEPDTFYGTEALDGCGACCHSTINHDYNLKTIRGDKVVVDNATGLMWHQSGSGRDVWGEHVLEWIQKLNESGYAGYRDWRMPTLEEAVSLMESSKRDGLYIDPIFCKQQRWIRTGDKVEDNRTAPRPGDDSWVVDFRNGGVFVVDSVIIVLCSTYVRPVRSME